MSCFLKMLSLNLPTEWALPPAKREVLARAWHLQEAATSNSDCVG